MHLNIQCSETRWDSRSTCVDYSIINVFMDVVEHACLIARRSCLDHFLPSFNHDIGTGNINRKQLQQHFGLYLLCPNARSYGVVLRFIENEIVCSHVQLELVSLRCEIFLRKVFTVVLAADSRTLSYKKASGEVSARL